MKIDMVYMVAGLLLQQSGARYVRNEGLHFNDAAYCIDAPYVIPAGSISSFQYGDTEYECIPAITILWRGE